MINPPREEVSGASVRDLIYQAELLDRMEADATARLQVQMGGACGDPSESSAGALWRCLNRCVGGSLCRTMRVTTG